jgi:hypothetical protein
MACSRVIMICSCCLVKDSSHVIYEVKINFKSCSMSSVVSEELSFEAINEVRMSPI